MAASVLTVTSEVPFASLLYWRLRIKDVELDMLTRRHRYERNFLAWETVRKQTNPFFETGTGLEGYLVGSCETPDEALDNIIHVCQNVLNSIARYYRFDASFRASLFDTLIGRRHDPKAIETWSGYLGATVARLRCNVWQNQPASSFHTETYRLVDTRPMIDYDLHPQTIEQVYQLGATNNNSQRIQVNVRALNPNDQDAWIVASSIGRFGHPLLRRTMDVGIL